MCNTSICFLRLVLYCTSDVVIEEGTGKFNNCDSSCIAHCKQSFTCVFTIFYLNVQGVATKTSSNSSNIQWNTLIRFRSKNNTKMFRKFKKKKCNYFSINFVAFYLLWLQIYCVALSHCLPPKHIIIIQFKRFKLKNLNKPVIIWFPFSSKTPLTQNLTLQDFLQA